MNVQPESVISPPKSPVVVFCLDVAKTGTVIPAEGAQVTTPVGMTV